MNVSDNMFVHKICLKHAPEVLIFGWSATIYVEIIANFFHTYLIGVWPPFRMVVSDDVAHDRARLPMSNLFTRDMKILKLYLQEIQTARTGSKYNHEVLYE